MRRRARGFLNDGRAVSKLAREGKNRIVPTGTMCEAISLSVPSLQAGPQSHGKG
jgi:hypothetical protein